jgi:hypothetical protein
MTNVRFLLDVILLFLLVSSFLFIAGTTGGITNIEHSQRTDGPWAMDDENQRMYVLLDVLCLLPYLFPLFFFFIAVTIGGMMSKERWQKTNGG